MTTPSGRRLSWPRPSFSLPFHQTSDLAGAVSLLASACLLGWLVASPSDLRYLALLPLAAVLVAGVVSMPYQALIVILCFGALAPEYIGLPLGALPGLDVTPTLLIAAAIALCGLRIAALGGLGLRQPWTLGAVLAFCAVWYVGAGFATTSGHDVRGWAALFQSPLPPLALVGGFLASSTPQGRRSLLLGLSASSTLAAALAIVEFATRQNVFLRLAQGLGIMNRVSGVGGIIPLPGGNLSRYGLARAEGAFTHPLMLGAFLVLGLLATLAWRSHQARPTRFITIAIGIQLFGLMSTVSGGPIVVGLLFVLLWFALEERDRARSRLVLPLIVGALSWAALANAGVGGAALGFLGFGAPAGSLAPNVQYRFNLLSLMLRGWQHWNAFGYSDVVASQVFRGLSSLDNQVAFLLATRGWVGILAWLGLVVVPPTVAVGRQLKGLPGRRFVILAPLAILMLGMDVGFFGLFTVYLYAALGLCWGSIAGGSPALARRDASAVHPAPSPRQPSRGNGVVR
jgi:hypothetical protein